MDLKTAAVTVLLMAGLHGQLVQAREVVVSRTRLQKVKAADLIALHAAGVVRIEGEQVFLDVDKLEAFARGYASTNGFENARIIRAGVVPYGMTEF